MGLADLRGRVGVPLTCLQAVCSLNHSRVVVGMAVSLPVFSVLWSAQEAEKIWKSQELSKILHNGILSIEKHREKGEKT